MQNRKISLNALRAFETVARHGSLTAAAAELRVSIAAVSRHIRLLEEQYGYRVFKRLPTGVELTKQGRLFYPHIADAFEKIEIAGRQLESQASEGQLDIWLYTSFAVEWFAPRLNRFRAAFPEIDLRLKISVSEADFDCDRVDLALTAVPTSDARLHSSPIFESCLVPVCAPSLLAPDILDKLSPLEMVRWLQLQTLLYEGREAVFWRNWFEAMGVEPKGLERGLRFESASHAYQVARSGGGVALGQTFYLAEDLQNGTLVTPVPYAINVPFNHQLVYRKSRKDEPLLTAFRTWLLLEAKNSRLQADSLKLVKLIGN